MTTNTQNTQNVIVTPEIQALIDSAVATAVSQTATAIINSMKKPVAKKANTRVMIQLGGKELLALCNENGIEPKTDIWLNEAKKVAGRFTLFAQYHKNQKAELEALGNAGMVAWSNGTKDMWANKNIIRLYADIPEGCQENYKMFMR